MKKTKMFKPAIFRTTFVLLLLIVFVRIAFPPKSANDIPDNLFGWKFPVAKFPKVGPLGDLAYSDIRDPGGIPSGLPVRLVIPVIGVDSAIEDALITEDGRMDVPAGSVNVAWFSLGPLPGQRGSAVIGGHFGIKDDVPFVFYDLDKLKIGDKVYIVNDKGENLSFVVKSTKSYDRDADATDVFTSGDGLAHLNLITCEGVWNKINNSYPKRLVVFTESIKEDLLVLPEPVFASESTKSPEVASPTSTPVITNRVVDRLIIVILIGVIILILARKAIKK